MQNNEAEKEAYIRRQNKQPKVVLDDGLDKRKRMPKKDKNGTLNIGSRGALNASNMHYHAEEKLIQQYYRTKFIEKVKQEKDEVSIVDELLIDLLAYCAVRVYRKAKLESSFGRFMDRTAPQDPVAQILSCIKSLGLKNTLKGNETGKEAISKILGQDAEEMTSNGAALTFDEWKASELSKGKTSIKRRALTDFAENDDFYQIENVTEEPMNNVADSTDLPIFEL